MIGAAINRGIDVTMGSTSELQMSIDFLVQNAKRQARDIDKLRLRAAVLELEKNVENGLHSEDLEKLAQHVVFGGNYDLMTRRKILYCLLPVDSHFPYKIIPLAISCAMVVPVNPSWQYSVLSWLSGLLEYCIIDVHNIYVHICYTPIFNLSSNLNLVLLVSKILGYMTRHDDITRVRVNFLMHLKDKPGFFEKVSQLLWVYQLFRPDMVVGRLSSKHLTSTAPRNLKRGLVALRERIQDTAEVDILSSHNNIWPKMNKAVKAAPHLRPTAIPKPDSNFYAETMEEKTEKIIFVSQYKRYSDLVSGIPQWKRWRWPNNPSALLSCPVIVPLFRPHHVTVLFGVSNWLQIALKTELIDGIGNPSNQRRENLLRAAHSLVKVTDTHIPVLNQFLAEYMNVWDQNSDLDIVLSLLEHVTYSSAEFVSVTLCKLLGELLDHAPMVKWCKVVETFSNTIGTWAVRAQKESTRTEDYLQWPCSSVQQLDSTIVGIWFLLTRMERFFLVALCDFECHPMIVHQILDFYVKVRMYAERLNLPVVFLPCIPITLAVVTYSDIVAVHRLGKLLASTPASVERVKSLKASGPDLHVQDECLSMCESFNHSVRLFMSGVHLESAFGKVSRKLFDQFYPFDSLQKMLNSKSVRKYASVSHALPYLPFFAKRIVNGGNQELDAGEALQKQVVEELKDAGFSGISECLDTYVKKL